MNEENLESVFSKNVIEFVTVANEYCNLVENVFTCDRNDFFYKVQKLLPLVYLKTSLLPAFEIQNEDDVEKFVNEQDWNNIFYSLRKKLDESDAYQKNFVPDANEGETNTDEDPTAGSISEDLTDIYQDLKDCTMLYRTGDQDIMNDALAECSINFEVYWGQRLLEALQAIHTIYFKHDGPGSERRDPDEHLNTDSWCIAKRQKDFDGDELE